MGTVAIAATCVPGRVNQRVRHKDLFKAILASLVISLLLSGLAHFILDIVRGSLRGREIMPRDIMRRFNMSYIMAKQR